MSSKQISQTDATEAKLRSFIERVERLLGEREHLNGDIKEVYSEAKGQGFEPGLMRQVIKLRKMDPSDRQEQEELLGIYMRACGMTIDSPVGQAALRSVS